MSYGTLALAYDDLTGRSSFQAVAPLLERVLRRFRVDPPFHLDLACGTALSADLFRRYGFRSVCVDSSLPMLFAARVHAECRIAGDLRRLPIAAQFGVITCLNESVRVLTRMADLTGFFRSIAHLMGRDSVFIFDLSTPAEVRRLMALSPFHYRGESFDVTLHSTYSRSRRADRLTFSGVITRGAEQYVVAETHYQRIYTRREIQSAIEAASLRVEEVVSVQQRWIFVVTACSDNRKDRARR